MGLGSTALGYNKMRILTTLNSLRKAFAYFVGIRPRALFNKVKSAKSYKVAQARARALYLERALKENRIQRFVNLNRINNGSLLNNPPDDFRAVLYASKQGPEVFREGKVKFSMINRVAVRDFLAALSLTESVEVGGGELDRLNTTHSSYVDSVELNL